MSKRMHKNSQHTLLHLLLYNKQVCPEYSVFIQLAFQQKMHLNFYPKIFISLGDSNSLIYKHSSVSIKCYFSLTNFFACFLAPVLHQLYPLQAYPRSVPPEPLGCRVMCSVFISLYDLLILFPDAVLRIVWRQSVSWLKRACRSLERGLSTQQLSSASTCRFQDYPKNQVT